MLARFHGSPNFSGHHKTSVIFVPCLQLSSPISGKEKIYCQKLCAYALLCAAKTNGRELQARSPARCSAIPRSISALQFVSYSRLKCCMWRSRSSDLCANAFRSRQCSRQLSHPGQKARAGRLRFVLRSVLGGETRRRPSVGHRRKSERLSREFCSRRSVQSKVWSQSFCSFGNSSQGQVHQRNPEEGGRRDLRLQDRWRNPSYRWTRTGEALCCTDTQLHR